MKASSTPFTPLIAAAAVTFFAACGGGTTEPPPDPPRATTITVSPATADLAALGATVLLSAEVRDQNGQAMAGAAVTWASGAATVATVSASGLVTAVANGTATITATSGSASGSATVTVAQEAVAVDLIMRGQVIASYDGVTQFWTGELEVEEGEETSYISVRFVDDLRNELTIDIDQYLEVEVEDDSIAEFEQDTPGEFGGHLQGHMIGETDVSFMLMRGRVGSGHAEFGTGSVRVHVW